MSNNTPIGAFFTPIEWAKWLLTHYKIFDSWVQGATICDPTAGTGKIIEAFIVLAKEKNMEITPSLLKKLYAVEKEKEFIDIFLKRMKERYGLDFPGSNFIHSDIILSNPQIKADILVGNPPWKNFNDLAQDYKKKIKPFFLEYKLAGDARKLLLGSSRVDIASLIVAMSINDNLAQGGDAYFFIPLSLVLNESTNYGFRKGLTKDTNFAIKEIWDFNNENIFKNVKTKYGIVHIKRDAPASYPVNYRIKSKEKWLLNFARPFQKEGDPFYVTKNKKEFLTFNFNIRVADGSKPRQGINTCGANDVFIFKGAKKNGRNVLLTANGGEQVNLPEKFVFPLISRENFRNDKTKSYKFILLPYDKLNGRVLTKTQLQNYPGLWSYLLRNQSRLRKRKGVLINNFIKRGLWWALFGVGPYSFSSCKIVWEAYGRKEFNPRIFTLNKNKPWQAHQSLQAYMPFESLIEANKILPKLKQPAVERYLQSFRAEGTCNWAQPGKIKRILTLISAKLP